MTASISTRVPRAGPVRSSLTLAILLLLPSIGIAEDGGQKFYGRNLERLVADVADWSTPHSLPSDHGPIYEVLLCQTRPWRASKTPHPDCRPMLYATGIHSRPGHILAGASKESDVALGSGDWYQLTPTWNDRLWTRFRDQAVWLDETAIFRSPDVDKLILEVAEWSQESAPPKSYRSTARFVFCQQDQGVKLAPPPRVESCYIAVFARGSMWKPGSIRFVDAGSSESWSPVTPKWDAMLTARLRRWEALRNVYSGSTADSASTYSAPAYRGCWYGKGEDRYVVACD